MLNTETEKSEAVEGFKFYISMLFATGFVAVDGGSSGSHKKKW